MRGVALHFPVLDQLSVQYHNNHFVSHPHATQPHIATRKMRNK